MKILELPVETTIECDCGCKFEYDTDDVTVRVVFNDWIENRWLEVQCPLCKKQYRVLNVES